MDGGGVQVFQGITVMVLAFFTTSFAEGRNRFTPAANWYLIYRKTEYKDIVKEIESTSKKVEALREDSSAVDKKGGKKKKNSTLETKLQIMQRDLTFMKMKSTVLVTLFMIVTMSSLGNYYQGIPVARLPFEPFSMLQSVTHRGLVGDNITECSYLFIYLLASYIFRANIQKFFGFEGPNLPSSMTGPFGMPMQQPQN
jgi:uncharacterized membrane protein (DUF106 family)